MAARSDVRNWAKADGVSLARQWVRRGPGRAEFGGGGGGHLRRSRMSAIGKSDVSAVGRHIAKGSPEQSAYRLDAAALIEGHAASQLCGRTFIAASGGIW